ncbi:MAG: hypothetical protein U5M51_03615 [Emticicia sp.]|nr:hypothetical protein [Emticicia sp.]
MDNLALFRIEDFRIFKGEIIDEILKAMGSAKAVSEDKLLSRTELAQILGVSKASITTYKNNGMPYKMVKRRPYFKLSEVENYMDLKNRKIKTKKG